jgi:hypothetical protein
MEQCKSRQCGKCDECKRCEMMEQAYYADMPDND